MIRSGLFCALSLILTPTLSAVAGEPEAFTGDSEGIGTATAHQVFVGIDRVEDGSRAFFKPVAYAAPKWRRARARLRAYTIDKRSPEALAATTERASKSRARNDRVFAGLGVVVAPTVKGGFSGRYRIGAMRMVVYLEDNQIIARTGDLAVMHKLPVVRSLKRLAGTCKGTLTHSIKAVAANADWKAVAVIVESECAPATEEGSVEKRRKLVVADVSQIIIPTTE